MCVTSTYAVMLRLKCLRSRTTLLVLESFFLTSDEYNLSFCALTGVASVNILSSVNHTLRLFDNLRNNSYCWHLWSLQ